MVSGIVGSNTHRPLDPEEIPPDLLELPALRRSGKPVPFNIYRTLAHHPDLLRQWLVFAEGIRFTGRLSERDRELLILRTGWNGCAKAGSTWFCSTW